MRLFRKNGLFGLMFIGVIGVTGIATPGVAEAKHHKATKVEVYVDLEPPPVKVEVVPAPRRGYVWVAGYWVWKPSIRQYEWVAGHWQKVRRGHHYVAGHWEKRPRGWIWVEGHWR